MWRSTFAKARRRMASMSPWNSVPQMAASSMYPWGLRMASAPSSRTPRLFIKSRISGPRESRAACSGTIPRWVSPGRHSPAARWLPKIRAILSCMPWIRPSDTPPDNSMTAGPPVHLLQFGADGQLGLELMRIAAGDSNLRLTVLSQQEAEFTRPDDIARAVMAQPDLDVVINAAAYTAVDRAESDSALAEIVNGTTVGR